MHFFERVLGSKEFRARAAATRVLCYWRDRVPGALELHKKLATARTPQDQTAFERQIAATDTQIDRLVYDLYGLTADEIKIVEGTI